MQGPDTTGNELARWLEEAGRRRAVRPAAQPESVVPPVVAPAQKPSSPRYLRLLILLGVAAVAFMPYLYADVQLTIYKLHSLIVFILNG